MSNCVISSILSLDQLMLELDGLESDFPGLISSYSAGTTYEGRGLRVAKVHYSMHHTWGRGLRVAKVRYSKVYRLKEVDESSTQRKR